MPPMPAGCNARMRYLATVRRRGETVINRHLCNAWASYPQSVDGGVRKLQLCNSPGMAARMRHPRCHSYSPGYGRLWAATASRPPPVRPALLLPHVVPGAGSPRLATGHATHAVLWTAPLDATAARTKGARSLRRATRREDVGDLCAEDPAGPVSPPTAGSHCLNRLPVHRSVLVAGRRGQAASGEPAIDIGYAPEWPTFMLASRSRRCGRHLIPSRVIIKRHRRDITRQGRLLPGLLPRLRVGPAA